MTPERWSIVEQLFGAASEMEPALRDAWLDEACFQDAALRREVESLLEADARAGEGAFITTAIAAAADSLSAEAEIERVGERVGAYRLMGEIGHGGMGTVYLASRDDGEYEATVAIKFVRGALASPDVLERLRRERQILADLAHPNIARLLDGGAAHDGTPYLIMEHIDGEPVDRHCERLGLGLEERVRLMRQVVLAVHHAHAARVVHRDIKPSNILVTKDGVPKLLDFGVAKLLDDGRDAGAPSKDTTTVVRATPAYASPEQLAGTSTSGSTDVYSLGVVLYELIAGRRPFDESSARSTSFAELERRLREQDPPPPSRLLDHSAEWHARVRGDLDRVLLKAIRVKPEERYATAAALADDLERWLEGEAVRAEAPSLARRARGLLRRRALVAAAVLVPIVVLAGGLAMSGWLDRDATETSTAATASPFGDPADSASRIVVLPFEDLSPGGDQQFLATGITEELLNALTRVEQLDVVGPASASRVSAERSHARAIGTELNAGLIVGGSIRRDGDRIRVRAELVDVASGSQRWSEIYERRLEDLFTLQEELALAIAGELRLELSRSTRAQLRERLTEHGDAYELYLRGRYEWSRRSETGIWNAIEAFRTAIAADPDFALAYAGLSDAYRLLPAYGNVSGPEALSLSKAAAVRAVALDESLAEGHTALAASTMEFDHDRLAAAREYRRALELNPREATALRWYGLHLASDGEFEAARDYVERALAMDPLSPVAIGSVGTVNYFARDPEEAERVFQEALALRPDWATGRAVLGRVYLMAGRFEEATRELERAAELSGGEANDRALVATAYAAAGREDEARAIVAELTNDTGGFMPAAGIAGVFAVLGESEEAIDWLERAMDLRDTDLKYVGVDPRFDPLHGSPRFDALLSRIGLR